MMDGHSFNFLAIESGPSNPPHAATTRRGGKKVEKGKEELYLIHMQQQHCFHPLSHTHSHSLPTSVFFSNFSCLKFGEILPKLVDFTLGKKEIKKIPNFFVKK
jgi:hypothetical protein